MQRYPMVFISIDALHVSGGSFAHYQELKTVYTASGICWSFFCFLLLSWVSSNSLMTAVRSRKKLDKYSMLCIKFWAPDDGKETPETCRSSVVINTIV